MYQHFGIYNVVALAFVWTSAVVVAVDAKRLGARRGRLGGGMFDLGVTGWFFVTGLLWLIGVIGYAFTRPKLVQRAALGPAPTERWVNPHLRELTDPRRDYAPVSAAPVYLPPPLVDGRAAPAGYYANPEAADGHSMRWWDGVKWEAAV